jgi:4-hydroxy-4-methyl-2-oxoglutarate aldolase
MASSSTADIVKELAKYPVATVYEAMGKIGDVSPRIRPMWQGIRLAGTALTIKVFPGDMQAIFHAIDTVAKPGDVLVVDAGDADRGTVWGGTGMAAAKYKGVVGLVTNGACRDLGEILEAKFPVYASGVSLRGTVRGHQGWINIPIAIGDVPVNPGDIILGDDDGVMVIPAARAQESLGLVHAQHDRETKRDDRLRAGESVVKVLNLPART